MRYGSSRAKGRASRRPARIARSARRHARSNGRWRGARPLARADATRGAVSELPWCRGPPGQEGRETSAPITSSARRCRRRSGRCGRERVAKPLQTACTRTREVGQHHRVPTSGAVPGSCGPAGGAGTTAPPARAGGLEAGARSVARSSVDMSASAKRRSTMPVRVRIHSRRCPGWATVVSRPAGNPGAKALETAVAPHGGAAERVGHSGPFSASYTHASVVGRALKLFNGPTTRVTRAAGSGELQAPRRSARTTRKPRRNGVSGLTGTRAPTWRPSWTAR